MYLSYHAMLFALIIPFHVIQIYMNFSFLLRYATILFDMEDAEMHYPNYFAFISLQA